jgi:hypothetical protein
MSLHEIVLLGTEPETERVRGWALWLVSPADLRGSRHGEWPAQREARSRASARTRAATEWRFPRLRTDLHARFERALT